MMTVSALSIQQLSKTYSNGVSALKEIDLTVSEGDFFALLGPNGAGKSTLIGILTSLVNKSKGKASIFSYDIDTHFNQAKRLLGVVPQEFNFNIFEKVEQILLYQAGYYGIPFPMAQKRVHFLLDKIGLWEKRNQTIVQLSGGMKRRLMIARALVHEPKLLILDEPTAGVDIEIRRSMWQFFKEVNEQGTTVILTTHYLEEAEHLCKNIAIIDHGRIIENTSMKNLLTTLNLETFILYLAHPIKFVPEIPNFNIRLEDETTLEVDLYVDQNLNDLFSELNRLSITVNSMRNKANRLEQLFVGIISRNHAGEV